MIIIINAFLILMYIASINGEGTHSNSFKGRFRSYGELRTTTTMHT